MKLSNKKKAFIKAHDEVNEEVFATVFFTSVKKIRKIRNQKQ